MMLVGNLSSLKGHLYIWGKQGNMTRSGKCKGSIKLVRNQVCLQILSLYLNYSHHFHVWESESRIFYNFWERKHFWPLRIMNHFPICLWDILLFIWSRVWAMESKFKNLPSFGLCDLGQHNLLNLRSPIFRMVIIIEVNWDGCGSD